MCLVMRRVVAFGLLLLVGFGLAGCGSSKNESPPNTELQVPDVPPGDRSTRVPVELP
jgi:hypothetical protein